MRTPILILTLLAIAAFPVHAQNRTGTGEVRELYDANCAACHIGGGNVVNAERTLKQADLNAYLDNYGNGHETAIAYQVTNGKNAMPAFGGKLSDTDIADVAAYVEQQAGNGWS